MDESEDRGIQDKPLSLLQPSQPPADLAPPVATKAAELPFGELPWESFEKLCMRLARQEGDPEHWQQYGTAGQAQDGIDILVRQPGGRYDTWQSKRYKNVIPSQVKKAADLFLKHKWAKRSSRFFLCLACSIEDNKVADQIVTTTDELKKRGITFKPWGSAQLSEKLRVHPKIVDEFFGRPWVERFCGQEAANSLNEFLSAQDAAYLRKELKILYHSHFDALDPGMLLATGLSTTSQHAIGLLDRYIEPSLEVDDQIEIAATQNTEPMSGSPSVQDGKAGTGGNPPGQMQFIKVRHSAFDWLATDRRHIVLGEPGAGKSSLLRFIALEILADEPRSESLARTWASHLPILVPFGLWTRLVRDDPSSCSLVSVVERWFSTLSEYDRIWKLARDALQKGEIILLVDGLDEWSNEQSARTAASLLQTFASTRNIPVIATSRPLGFKRLQPFDATWQTATLPGLGRKQRLSFTCTWFLHHEASIHSKIVEELNENERNLAKHKAHEFLRELATRPGLAELGSNPLLLWGLISVGISTMQLPRSRVKAYQELTNLMLQLHPGRRLTATFAGDTSRQLSEMTERKSLAALALEIHRNWPEGAIKKEDAIAVVCNYIADDIGFDRKDAQQNAEAVISAATASLGILVEREPDKIGFFHRSFQEYLAAEYLAAQPLQCQLDTVKENCTSPPWFDVIVSLLHLISRPTEVDQIVDVIKVGIHTDSTNPMRKLLLAEAAFGEQLCSTKVARLLAAQVFEQIESDSPGESTTRLLTLAVGGLNSDLVSRDVQEAIDRWYPRRFGWLEGVYTAVGDWPVTEDMISFLLRGISEDNDSNRRAAAKALGKCAAGSPEVYEKLVLSVGAPTRLASFYGAMEALLVGWPSSDIIKIALESSNVESDPTLQLLALKYRVAAGIQAEDDLATLLSIASDHYLGMYLWAEDIVDCFVNGWPDNEEIKNACIQSIGYGPRQIDRDIATAVLVKRTSDPDVQMAISDSIRAGNFALMNQRRLWAEIGQAEPNGLFSDVIDHWLRQKEKSTLIDAEAAAASGSDWARSFLIGFLNQDRYSAANAADSLVSRWGINDPIVQNELRQALNESTNSKLAAAPYVADLIKDGATGKQKLLELVPECDKTQLYRVILGFKKLGIQHDDAEVIDKLLEFEFDSDKGPLSAVEDVLINTFGENDRVREIAELELQRRYGAITAVAQTYSNNKSIREKIFALNGGLRKELRLALVERLGREAVNKEYPIDKLAQYDSEEDWAIKSLGSIEYHRSIRSRPDIVEQEIGSLGKRLHVIGPDMDPRRAAAVLGLLALNRVDIFRDSLDYNDKSECIDVIGDSRNGGHPKVLTFIAENWNHLEQTLGKDVLERLLKYSGECTNELALLAPFADGVPELEKQIEEQLDLGNSLVEVPPELLRWLARRPEKRNQLLDVCLKILHRAPDRYNWYQAATTLSAGALIGNTFRGDYEIGQTIEKNLSANESMLAKNGLLIALCSGWPKSDVLKKTYDSYKGKAAKDLLTPAAFHMVCVMSASDIVLQWLDDIVSTPDTSNWDFISECVPPVLHRLRNDKDLIGRMIENLKKDPTPGQKASIPRLIVSAVGLSDDISSWCMQELEADHPVAEIGFDMIFGDHRLVRESLLEVVGGTS